MAIPTESPKSPTSGPSPATPARGTRTGPWWKPEARTSRTRHLLVAATLAATAAACTPRPEAPQRIALAPVAFADLPGWAEGRQAAALSAFQRSCAVLMRAPAGKSLGAGGIAGRVEDWRPACSAAQQQAAGDDAVARAFFTTWFRPFAMTAGNGADALLTGYYEPGLRGALERGGRYQVPLYGRPDDLVTADLGAFDTALAGKTVIGRVAGGKLVPYPARREIDGGALAGRAAPLVWVDSAIDAFFLHVQGSGRVSLPGGKVMRLGFAGSNGRPYTAIGRILAERGAIARERMSMQAIRAWLSAHPEKARAVMAENERYIFFRRLPGEGPVGAQGVALTAEHSLAVDRGFIPLGVPLWVDTHDPLAAEQPFRRLMVAQDTGSAIRGALRGDIFFGHGRLAERRAGRMRGHGRLFVLLPKGFDPAS